MTRFPTLFHKGKLPIMIPQSALFFNGSGRGQVTSATLPPHPVSITYFSFHFSGRTVHVSIMKKETERDPVFTEKKPKELS